MRIATPWRRQSTVATSDFVVIILVASTSRVKVKSKCLTAHQAIMLCTSDETSVRLSLTIDDP